MRDIRGEEIRLAGGTIICSADRDETVPTALRETELHQRLEAARGELAAVWEMLDAQIEAAESRDSRPMNVIKALCAIDQALGLVEHAQKVLTC